MARRLHECRSGCGRAWGAGARRSHAPHAGADDRHHQRGVGRARDAPRARARAVSARAATRGVQGALPRERSDGAVREGIRLQQRRDRELRGGPGLAADAGRAVDDDAEERQAVRHSRHRALARVAQRERRHDRRARRRRPGSRAGLRRQGRDRQVRAGRERRRRRVRTGGSARRGRGVGCQRHRRAAHVRLPESDRLDDRERDDAGTSAWALSPNTYRELQRILASRPEGHDSLDRQERAGADDESRSSTPRFLATAARRRKSRSAATCTKASSSRAPTTTTRAAR